MRALLGGSSPALAAAPAPRPAEDQVLVRTHAASLDPAPEGEIMGLQGTGRIEEDPQGLLPTGTAVAWAGVPGSCAQWVCVPRHRVVAVPRGIDTEVAATMLLPAMTAHLLLFSLRPVEAGATVLINPADDPVGLIAAQWVHALGARAIAVSASGESGHLERATVVRRAHVAPRRAAEVGGVDLALHGAGKPGLEHALSSLRRRGTLCLYGDPEQPVKRLSPVELAARGSLSLACPRLEDYLEEPDGFRMRSQAVTQAIVEGTITVPLAGACEVEEAADAAARLRRNKSTGLVAVRF
ncbi:zinc-binding dehydrogenase [Corynebacterium mastitidis]|nr:zinc-binding dehydrogenase [Corynebacterium mastitidis]MCH6196053.1 zinc-binding dehydrogenase [Corynebacterium mastitidis]